MILPLLLACAVTPPPVAPAPSPRSDWGHPGERDLAALVQTVPAVRGTRLDDCGTCHCGGVDCAEPVSGARPTNVCDGCHLVAHPDPGIPGPTTFRETLNPYGLAWLEAGRDAAAFAAIGAQDSDGDGAGNDVELGSQHFPGDPRSRPGQTPAPLVRFSLAQLRALPAVEQLTLANAPSANEDVYATWEGVRLRDLLEAAGVPLHDPAITGVTLVSPDGYRKELDWARVLAPAPAATFFAGLDVATLGERCGWVTYPAGRLPEPGAALPPAWTIAAWARDGAPLAPVALDIASRKLSGEGPLRAVVPQARPGPPDRGARASPSGCGDTWDHDPAADHNAGWMVRGLVAVRVDPLPAGLEDLEWSRGGWAWVERGELVVYGRGVAR